MGWDFKFDPVTKDTISDGNGSISLTDASDTAVMLQLDCDFAAWWGDKDAGSLLRNLRAFGAKPEISVPAEAKRALRVLEDRGVISGVEATAERVVGRVNLNTLCRDTRTGRTIKVSR